MNGHPQGSTALGHSGSRRAPELNFTLHSAIDVEGLRLAFAREGRVQIAPFLRDEDATRLRDHLRGRDDWKLVFNSGEKVFEVPRTGPSALTEEQETRLRQAVGRDATTGFHYCFETVRVPDEERDAGDPLHVLADFLSSEEVLGLLRRVTGRAAIDFADAQATAYGSGDFLTAHDDEVEGKNRHAAYVLGLTEQWRTEWGGLLLFHDDKGDVERGWRPRMNALSLFAVPQLHSVSQVVAFAPARRYSVTGWLRGR